jgi:hypothetical protein
MVYVSSIRTICFTYAMLNYNMISIICLLLWLRNSRINIKMSVSQFVGTAILTVRDLQTMPH